MQEEKVAALREWMVAKGCRIHPHLAIPARMNGVQGVGTSKPIPAKTLIVAVPASLILTVTRCYNDPVLKRLFLGNDDLFDYQSSEDAEFNVLCVFIMYHKLNLQQSEWKEYLQTIAQPETAVDWQDAELKGLNKSLIEEVIHVRIECQKLESELVGYLMKRKEFQNFPEDILRTTFNYCYRAVMTRCFGYYFNQACLIPIADLINHGCQAIDHQLLNVNFEREIQFQEGYYPRKDKINCQLLSIKGLGGRLLPFRERFLVENGIVQNDEEKIAALDRKQIDSHLYAWNSQRLKEGEQLEDLHFCSEDEEEDNDTDEEFEVEQIRELDHCRQNQQQQMKEFMENFVKIERYADVEKKLEELEGEMKEKVEEKEGKEEAGEVKEEVEKEEVAESEERTEKIENLVKAEEVIQGDSPPEKKEESSSPIEQKPTQPPTEQAKPYQNPFSNSYGRGVPIQMVDSSSEQDEDEQQWGLKDGSYFTMATSSPVAANKQIYNSYGSRTNKFLLIWYGFTYPDNLYDSVTVRLQVQFGELRPAKEIVLDSYIGGQGLSFKKPNLQVVKESEISREFRFKRSNINEDLLIFLRLYLMNYYKGQDLYKLFVTFPASADFELFVFRYYRDIILALYERYPEAAIQLLKEECNLPEYAAIQFKIRYKIIYLEEQRKLLDLNLRAVDVIIDLLEQANRNGGVLEERMFSSLPIDVLRMVRKYLIAYRKNKQYILYSQPEIPQSANEPPAETPKQPSPPTNKKQPISPQDSWQSESSSSSQQQVPVSSSP